MNCDPSYAVLRQLWTRSSPISRNRPRTVTPDRTATPSTAPRSGGESLVDDNAVVLAHDGLGLAQFDHARKLTPLAVFKTRP
jgi:hypothetical protein